MTTRRLISAFAAAALVFAACGGSDSADDGGDDPDTTEAVADDGGDDAEEFTEDDGNGDEPEVADDTVADETTTDTEPAEPEPEPVPAETDGDVGDAAAGSAFEVSLSEWAVEAPTEYAAGDITFTVSNDGGFPHEFVVIQGEGYESLPLAEGGAVIEDELPTGALIGRTARFGGGSSEDLTVTLAPGNYVLVCNLGSGGSSHAGQGQRLDITVT